jgi:C-terminal processing protease CtpA/Prc
MPRFSHLFLLLTGLMLVSCGDDSDREQSCAELVNANQCSVASQNQCVHQLMQRNYLWYEQLPQDIDYDDFVSPQETLDFLRYGDPGPDRFSYVTTAEAFDALFAEGQYIGFGFSYISDSAGRLWVRFVYADSPAGSAGMRRGDEILEINGRDVASLTAEPGWQAVLGGDEVGYPLTMSIRHADLQEVEFDMQKAVVNINTVLHSSVIEVAGENTGYLVFSSFLNTSKTELAQVFDEFHAAGASRVILDLRYNGGGSVEVSRLLASYLRPGRSGNEVFNRLQFNDQNRSEDTSLYLSDGIDGLSLDRVVVITSSQTCSASEMVINGLKPYLDVRTLGSTTCGKPVGMRSYFFCDAALVPVTFRIENSQGLGDYFEGLDADCPLVDNEGSFVDDYTYPFGATDAPVLQQALGYAATGECPAQRPAHSSKGRRALPRLFDNQLEALIGAV